MATGSSAVVRYVASSDMRTCCSCKRHAEIADADLVGPARALLRPYAAMGAGIGGDADVVAEVDGLAAGHAQHPIGSDAGGLHHPNRLVAPDQRRRGIGHDRLRPEQVVEMGVAHEDPVALGDVGSRPTGTGCGRRSVDVGVEEDGEASGPQAECRASVPIEGGAHLPRLARYPGPVRAWSLGRGQSGGTVDAVGKDGIPGVPYPTEVLAGSVGGAGGGQHFFATGGDGRAQCELQLGVDLVDRLGESALVADQADCTGGRRHGGVPCR